MRRPWTALPLLLALSCARTPTADAPPPAPRDSARVEKLEQELAAGRVRQEALERQLAELARREEGRERATADWLKLSERERAAQAAERRKWAEREFDLLTPPEQNRVRRLRGETPATMADDDLRFVVQHPAFFDFDPAQVRGAAERVAEKMGVARHIANLRLSDPAKIARLKAAFFMLTPEEAELAVATAKAVGDGKLRTLHPEAADYIRAHPDLFPVP
jgi:hypothetical protein